MRRYAIVGTALVGTVALATSGSSAAASPKGQTATNYAERANLTQDDLPLGWKSQSVTTGSGGSVSSDQTHTIDSMVSGLPADCAVLRRTFVASLENAPPVGSKAQAQAQFASEVDAGATISSTVAVFGTPARSQATYDLYAASSFPGCLKPFLRKVLMVESAMSVESVSVTPIAVPGSTQGVQAVAFAVAQSASQAGEQAEVSRTQEVVIRSGRAMAFLEEESDSTAIPTDVQNNFDKSVSLVAKRLVPPPA